MVKIVHMMQSLQIVALSAECTGSSMVTDSLKDPDYVPESYTESLSSVSYEVPYTSQFICTALN